MDLTETNPFIRTLRRSLQNMIGRSPKVKIKLFENWAGTQKRRQILAVSPRTVSEVQDVIRAAHELGLRVRAVGSGMSWSPLFSDEGNIIMYVGKLQRPDGPRIELTQDKYDPAGLYVTMATGVTTGEFMDFQMRHDMCIPANVIVRVTQMGGVITTGSHGTGSNIGCVSDSVTHMRIIDSDGRLRSYTLREDPDMMHAVQCSLGLWGILVDLTVKVEPMVMVETTNLWIKVKDIFYNKWNLCQLIQKNWSVELMWFPFNSVSGWEAFEAFTERKLDYEDWDPGEDDVWVRIINKPRSYKTPDVIDSEEVQLIEYNSITQIKEGVNLVDLIWQNPHVTPGFTKTLVSRIKKIYGSDTILQPLTQAIHFRPLVEAFPVYEMEWTFSVDDDCTNIQTAVLEVVKLVTSEARMGRFPMNLPLEMRFQGVSDAYMAPTICANPIYGGSGHCCHIEVVTIAKTPHWESFCQKVANVWKRLYGARPHWAKQWSFLRDIEEIMRQAYVLQMPRFLEALKRSGADPDGMFFNNDLARIFYPDGHPGRSRRRGSRQSAIVQTHDRANGGRYNQDMALYRPMSMVPYPQRTDSHQNLHLDANIQNSTDTVVYGPIIPHQYIQGSQVWSL